MTVTLQSKISIPPSVYFQPLVDEAVLLNTATGKYYGLDDVGTRMWNLLVEHKNLETAFQVLQVEYDVDGKRLQDDLLEFVNKLTEQGLVILDEPVAKS